MKNQSGFTLIEVVIAVTILAFISLFTAQMISQGVKSKAKIQAEIDSVSALNAAMQLMVKDLELAFNYRDINIELYNAAQDKRKKDAQGAKGATGNSGATGDSPTPPPPENKDIPQAPPEETDPDDFKHKEERKISKFLGEKEKIDFTSLNNFRAKKNLQQSDQMEVGYYLDKCSSRLDKEKTSDCLWRRTSPYIDDDIREGGSKTVLLENVKSIRFRYLEPQTNSDDAKWLDTWLSEGGEEIAKDKFPPAVEISIIILDIKKSPPREIAMTVVAPLRFTNNKKDKKSEAVN